MNVTYCWWILWNVYIVQWLMTLHEQNELSFSNIHCICCAWYRSIMNGTTNKSFLAAKKNAWISKAEWWGIPMHRSQNNYIMKYIQNEQQQQTHQQSWSRLTARLSQLSDQNAIFNLVTFSVRIEVAEQLPCTHSVFVQITHANIICNVSSLICLVCSLQFKIYSESEMLTMNVRRFAAIFCVVHFHKPVIFDWISL